MKPKTWLTVNDGKQLINHGIDIMMLSKLLGSLQMIFDNIVESKYGTGYKKVVGHPFIKEMKEG